MGPPDESFTMKMNVKRACMIKYVEKRQECVKRSNSLDMQSVQDEGLSFMMPKDILPLKSGRAFELDLDNDDSMSMSRMIMPEDVDRYLFNGVPDSPRKQNIE